MLPGCCVVGFHDFPLPSTFLQTFHTPSLGDEEFEIPPITPPPETESGLGLSEVDSPFPTMPEPPALHRGHLIPQFPPQSLDLPSITISRNMMDQEGLSVNNGQRMVSTGYAYTPLVNQEVCLFSAIRKMLSSSVNTQKSCTSASPVCVLLVAAVLDVVSDGESKLKDMI